MKNDQILKQITPLFQKVFNNTKLKVSEKTSAASVEGWDSFAHINLIVALEQYFKISFTTKELGSMQCVGDLIKLLAKKKIKK